MKNKDILLSICIPTYNRCDQITLLLHSIFEFEGKFEVCVHVDGSNDGTIESISNITDSRFKFYFSDNQGRAKSLNNLVNMASGRFIMFFDDVETFIPIIDFDATSSIKIDSIDEGFCRV